MSKLESTTLIQTEYKKYKFRDICLKKGFVRGPFGSALKKSLFVPKGKDTYKVYEQCVPLEQNKNGGHYYITGEYFRNSLSRFEVRHNDFLVSCSGVNYGAIYHLQEPFEKGVINQALLIIRIDDRIVDHNYFKYLFRIILSKAITSGTGDSTIPNFPSLDVIKNIDVYLPSLDTQRKIGKTLDDIDNKINTNKRIGLELESMAKTLYDYWFTQFDFPNKDGKPYRSSGGVMEWNEQLKREIPKGWNVRRLSDICSFRNGINYEKGCTGNKIYKIANVRNITASSLLMDVSDFDEISIPSEQADRYAIKKNDIVIARSGTPGATRLILNPSGNVIFCGFIICCTPEDSNHRMFLSHFLKQLEGTNATKTGGSILQNVSQDTLKSLYVPMPNDEVINSFNEKTIPMIEMIQHAIDENSELARLRNWLLPMLMNGQVTVE